MHVHPVSHFDITSVFNIRLGLVVLQTYHRVKFCTYFMTGECVEKWTDTKEPRHFSKHNNETACTSNDGEWLEFHNFLEIASTVTNEKECLNQQYIWGRPIYGNEKVCLVPLPPPDCSEAPWSRVNHLGNSAKGDLETPNYVWNLPHFPSNTEQRCVLRIR